MSIIEQAARRLEELRRAGIDVPPRTAAPTAPRLPTGQPAPRSTARSKMVDVDLKSLERNGYVVHSAPRTRLADEFRAIKRPLLVNIRGESAAPIRRANCILVTSALPGEGKTFTAVNLAMSMSMEVDSHVLLIDADILRPTVFDRLGLAPEEKGLLDKLNDPEISLADLILRTNIDKLSVLPAGKPNARATELLASEAMRAIVDELATRYADRIVIFDAPPLLAAQESRVLATHVGQIVVVVEAQKTSRRALTDALALLEACPVVMTILNKSTGPATSVYGGYGYA